MKENFEPNGKDNLDESFSNSLGSFFNKLGDDISSAANKAKQDAINLDNKAKDEAKHLAESAKNEAKHLAESAKDEAKHIAESAKDEAKHIAQSAKDEAKHLAESAKDEAKHLKEGAKDAIKKAKKTLKNLAGKIRATYKKILRKAILKYVYMSIRMNEFGVATRLYPAVISENEALGKNFAKGYIPKAHKVYDEILAKWINFGGEKSKLDDAITKGSKITVSKKKKSGFDGYSNAEGDEGDAGSPDVSSPDTDITSPPESSTDALPDVTDPTAETANTEVIPPADAAEVADAGMTDPQPEEKKSGWKKFTGWIHGLFHKHDATASPYQAGTPSNLPAVPSGVVTGLPSDSLSLNQLDKSVKDPKDSGKSVIDLNVDTTIMGMPKMVFWGGMGLIALTGAFFIYKHFKK